MYDLSSIESKYREEIAKEAVLTPASLVELCLRLYNDVKIEGVSEEYFGDVLLFQYGVHDWFDGLGRHFEFDITRQFQMPPEHEPYQLSIALLFEPQPFEGIGFHELWSADLPALSDFASHIKNTEGFKLATENAPKTFRVQFAQC